MPLQLATIDTDRLVRSFVATASGLAKKYVIPGDDNNPRPNKPYATVKRVADIAVGVDQEIYRFNEADPENQIDITTVGSRVASYSIQFYRSGTLANARRCRRYPHTPLGRELLHKGGLVFKSASDVTDLSILLSSKIEERVAITMEFRYTETDDAQTVNSIDIVEVDIHETAETDLEENLEIDRNAP